MIRELLHSVAQLAVPIALVAGIVAAEYVLSVVEWRLDDDHLVLRWKILFVVPMTRWRIPLDNIEDVRPMRRRELFSARLSEAAQVIGPVLRRPSVLVVLRKRRWLVKRYAVAATDPDRFLAAVRARLARATELSQAGRASRLNREASE